MLLFTSNASVRECDSPPSNIFAPRISRAPMLLPDICIASIICRICLTGSRKLYVPHAGRTTLSRFDYRVALGASDECAGNFALCRKYVPATDGGSTVLYLKEEKKKNKKTVAQFRTPAAV